VEVLKNRKAKMLVASIKKVCTIFGGRGFRVRTAHADNEFEPLQADLYELGIHDLNVVSEGENVPEIERCVSTVKERTRCTHATVPFIKIV
jgi:hypothetical protein